MHLHTLPLTSGGGTNTANPITGKAAPPTDDDVIRQTFATLKRYTIVKAMTSGPLAPVKTYNSANPDRVTGSLHLDDETLLQAGIKSPGRPMT